MQQFKIILSILFLNSCIGIDYIDDPQVNTFSESRIEVDEDNIALLISDMISLMPRYYNDSGKVTHTSFNYSNSAPSIVSLSEDGEVEALSVGQATISITTNNLQKDVLITVVNDSASIARISIDVPSKSLNVGQEVQLSAKVFTFSGQDVTAGSIISYFSSKPAVAAVNSSGNLTALANGSSEIYASASGINSNKCLIEVGGNARSGTFTGQNGYDVSGSVIVTKTGESEIAIDLQSDFNAENGPGLYVYLSNQSNTVSGGIEVSKLLANSGAQKYTINVKLSDYNYVLIHCKPFNVPFGSAPLN